MKKAEIALGTMYRTGNGYRVIPIGFGYQSRRWTALLADKTFTVEVDGKSYEVPATVARKGGNGVLIAIPLHQADPAEIRYRYDVTTYGNIVKVEAQAKADDAERREARRAFEEKARAERKEKVERFRAIFGTAADGYFDLEAHVKYGQPRVATFIDAALWGAEHARPRVDKV